MLHKNDLEDDVPAYIRDRVPVADMKTVFDVGANVGWFSYQFLRAYPEVEIWAFEPVKSLCKGLEENLVRFTDLAPFPRTKCVQLALGDTNVASRVSSHERVTVNRIVSDDYEGPSEEIVIMTGDDFAAQNGVDRINFLKIDAEGYDLKVLHGFHMMLQNGAIDFIQVEASLSPTNIEHIPLEQFRSYIEPFGYRLFRFANQASGPIPILTRADVVFIHEHRASSYMYT